MLLVVKHIKRIIIITERVLARGLSFFVMARFDRLITIKIMIISDKTTSLVLMKSQYAKMSLEKMRLPNFGYFRVKATIRLNKKSIFNFVFEEFITR